KPSFFIATNERCAHCGAPPSSSSGLTTPRDPSPAKAPEKSEKPKKINNGWYLSIILGNNIDLTMSSSERFNFKKDYENFKVRVTATMFAALCYASMFPSRASDSICIFLAIWYYCTLTVRESILILNGSSIHWWWVAHHYLATALAGVIITWPDDEAYQEFRPQAGIFSMYICVVQQLQYQYQSGCLRRLHALGSLKSEMDVTLEGFASWMFHGLTFLLPFLAIAYFFELYNSYSLLMMWLSREHCVWQVLGLSVLLAIVGVGNLIMVSGIVFQKIKETPTERKHSLTSK
ncbi:hypothetical protein PMAYCL1PPCAC_10945, partial [Pristionchus mayeri]